MNKRYALNVRGKYHEWSFPIWANPQHVKDWRNDGLDIDEVLNVIPAWVVALGLTDLWVWVEDLLRGGNK